MRSQLLPDLLTLAALTLATACVSAPPELPAPPAAGLAFQALEERLIQSKRVNISFTVNSTGLLRASFTGTADIGSRKHATLAADGRFMGAEQRLDLELDSGFLFGGSSEGHFETPAPAALAEGLLIGCTRMGLLHNLAKLASGAPPDRTDGTIRDWVQTRDHAWVAGEEGRALRFTISVGGEDAGEATLWLDADGLPVRREQTVDFPTGSMEVVEVYDEFRVD